MNNNQIGGSGAFKRMLEKGADAFAGVTGAAMDTAKYGAETLSSGARLTQRTVETGEQAANAAKKITKGTGEVAEQGLGAATESLKTVQGLAQTTTGLTRAASDAVSGVGSAFGLVKGRLTRAEKRSEINEEALNRAKEGLSATKAEELQLEAERRLNRQRESRERNQMRQKKRNLKEQQKTDEYQRNLRKENIKGKLSDIINKTKTELNKKFFINMTEDTQKEIVNSYFNRKKLFGKSYSKKVKDKIFGEGITENDKEMILITINDKIKQYIDMGSFSGGSKTLNKKRKMKNKSTKRKQGTRHKRRKLKKIRKKTLKKN